MKHPSSTISTLTVETAVSHHHPHSRNGRFHPSRASYNAPPNPTPIMPVLPSSTIFTMAGRRGGMKKGMKKRLKAPLSS
ncbi:MAG: hypothetical protein GWP17_03040 [Aquificales bacterium]|nr:hypothetical protein [Aquificales bacterium]